MIIKQLIFTDWAKTPMTLIELSKLREDYQRKADRTMQLHREANKYALAISVTDGVETWHAESLIGDTECIQEYLQQLCEELMCQVLLLDEEIKNRLG